MYDRVYRQDWTIEESLLTLKLTKSERLRPHVQKNETTIVLGGKERRISTIAKEFNISKTLLYNRLKNGWNISEAIHTKSNKGNAGIRKAKVWIYNDEALTLKELAAKYNIREKTLRYRLKTGWAIKDAIQTIVSFDNKKLKL
mgnify:CR=1 FL=1